MIGLSDYKTLSHPFPEVMIATNETKTHNRGWENIKKGRVGKFTTFIRESTHYIFYPDMVC